MNEKKFTNHIKLLFIFLFSILLYTPAINSENIVRNEVEDPRLTGEEFEGADPNVLTILDLSGSMGRNYGGEQVGDWDGDDVFRQCFGPNWNRAFCAENIANLTICSSQFCRGDGHNCESADDFSQLIDCVLETGRIRQSQINSIIQTICGNNCNEDERNHAAAAIIGEARLSFCGSYFLNNDDNSIEDCTNFDEDNDGQDDDCNECTDRFSINGNQDDSDKSCDSNIDFNSFSSCMNDTRSIPPIFQLDNSILTIIQPQNCTGGTESCRGRPEHGSTRMDVALNVFFDVLDADNSLSSLMCNDENNLWDNMNGTSPIQCNNFLNTPFRNVENFIYNGGTISSSNPQADNLPGTGGIGLRDLLTDEDADLLPVNFLPMSYSGQGNDEACTNSGNNTRIPNQNAFRMADGGFQGGNGDALKRVWDFYRDQGASGGTPLAHIIGYDDAVNPTAGDGSTSVSNDALLAFSNGLNDDDSVECRPQFAIVITDGDDSCAGDCSNNSSACSGGLSGFNNESNAFNNPNRRSSVQAISNLRTYFTRSGNTIPHPDPDISEPVKKEVLTFVIGLGINDERSIKALNAMALAGGTHTKGIIKHIDPATGNEFGAVSVDPLEDCIDLSLDIEHPSNSGKSAICGTPNDEFEVYRQIGRGDGIGSNTARIRNCGNGINNTPDINGSCSYSGTGVFDNDYFNEPLLLPPDEDGNQRELLEGFAFLANSPEELTEAIQDILLFIDNFTTTGVAPSAPQTAGNVTLRDRVFLALTNPIPGERLWQGRLGLYSFVNDPSRPGTSLIVRKPASGENFTSDSIDLEELSIFTNGRLNENARQFHWEAGNLLARRDPGTRNIFFTEQNFQLSQAGTISYLGGLMTVEYESGSNSPTNIAPSDLGIEDEDVTVLESFPPGECDEDSLYDCSSDCENIDAGNIDNSMASDCRDCIKGCFRDRVISFISGNTNILPGEENVDPLGHICNDGTEDFDPTTIDPDVCSVRMGDIFHSSPRTVASPSVLFFDTGFQVYTRAFQQRSAVVYAGANDGGLHAFHAGDLVDTSSGPQKNPFNGNNEALPFFDAGTGSEMFYYIPPTFFPDAVSEISPETPFGIQNPPVRDYRFGDLKTYVLGDPEHRSFFDGTVSIADVFIDGFDNGISPNFCDQDENDRGVSAAVDGLISTCGKEWHTVLISGFRNGGGGITALDVTNANCAVNGNDPNCDISTTYAESDTSIFRGNSPGYPTHLWTVFDQDFGNTWSNPEIARVRLRGTTTVNGVSTEIFADRWVAFVGGGIDPLPTDNKSYGNAFYAVDITTGQIIYKFHPDRSIPDNLDSGISTDQEELSQNMVCEMASDPGIFDINADGYTDIVYIGDTCGRLWRFDVSQPLNTGNSAGTGNIINTGLTINTDGSLTRGNETIDASGWRASIAFCANRDPGQCGSDDNPDVPLANIEPIFFPPTSAIDNIGRRHVIFQTGNRRNPTRIAEFINEQPVTGTHSGGRLYNFIDTFVPSFLAGSLEASEISDRGMLRADNISRTISLNQDGDSEIFSIGSGSTNDEAGEFIVEYPNNSSSTNGIGGEKGVGIPAVINSTLVFVSFAPTPFERALPCRPAFGDTRVFALDFVTGAPALSRIRGAVAANNNISSNSAGLQLSQGISSGTTLTYGSENSVILTISSSGNEDGASFIVWEVPLAVQTQTLFWEEVL